MKINLEKTLLLILICLGIFLRIHKWSKLDTFAGDEGIQLIYAEDILHGNYFPITGEISSLDQENQFILHNSPIGIYFQTLLYFISFKSETIYLLCYTFINMAVIVLLYKAVLLLTNKKSAQIALVLLLFSPFMLRASVWTSQPVNALFFESIAIYLIAKFFKYKNENHFIWGVIFSILATQMYPPMYFLILPKIFCGIYLLKNKIHNQTKALFIIIFATSVIYLPFLLMELKYNFVNTNSVFNFLQEIASAAKTEVIHNSIAYEEKVRLLNNKLATFFTYEFIGKIAFIILYSCLVLFTSFSRSAKGERKKLLFLFILALSPFISLLILYSKSSVSGERAYIDVAFPFIIILFASIHEKISVKIVHFFLLLYLSLSLVPMSDYYFNNNSNSVNIKTIQNTAQYIIADSKKRGESHPFIHVINKGDVWGWDSSIYWYKIEKELNFDLVTIDFNTSKAKLSSTPKKNNYIYLVCHGYDMKLCLNDFKTIKETSLYKKNKYTYLNSMNIENNIVIILETQ